MQPNYQNEVMRAALPAVLFASDIATSLGLEDLEAEVLVRQDRFGPHLLIGGRPAVLRESYLAKLAEIAREPNENEKEVL